MAPPTFNAAACTTGTDQDLVMVTMVLAGQDPPGTSVGFDLDGYTATSGDPKTCGHKSLKDAQGHSGIDNQLSGLIPVLEQETGDAADALIRDSINNGMLLVGVRLRYVDSLVDDDCIEAEFLQLMGTPTVGTDKVLDANQTFDVNPNGPHSITRGAITGGVLELGPFDLTLPVRVLDAHFDLVIRNARVRLDVASDGSLKAVAGGGAVVEEIITELLKYAIGDDLKKLLPGVLRNLADLDQDPGTMVCRQMSAAIELSMKKAFINF